MSSLDREITPAESSLAQRSMGRRRVLGLALPIMGENLLQTLVTATGTVLVGHLGKEQLAGVGTSSELVYFIVAMLISLDVGATVLVSQAIGAGRSSEANELARQAVVFGIIISIPISIGGFLLADRLVGFFNLEPSVAGYATTYLRITAASSLTMMLTFVSGAVLRGAGDSRTPLYAAVVANIVNLVSAYTLIFGHFGAPRLGVAGAALAGTLGRAASACILLALLLGGDRVISIRGRQGWRPQRVIVLRLVRLGVPSALEEVLISGGFTTMLRVVATLGTASIAAQNIAFSALSVFFMPAFAFGVALTALVGQTIGAGRPEQARRAFDIAIRWALAIMGVGAVVSLVFAPGMIGIFTNDADVQRAGETALRALALGIPLWAVWVCSGGALRGTGDTRTPMVASIVAVWGAVALAFLAVHRFDGGLGTIWLMFLITTPIASFTNLVAFRRSIAQRIRRPAPQQLPTIAPVG